MFITGNKVQKPALLHCSFINRLRLYELFSPIFSSGPNFTEWFTSYVDNVVTGEYPIIRDQIFRWSIIHYLTFKPCLDLSVQIWFLYTSDWNPIIFSKFEREKLMWNTIFTNPFQALSKCDLKSYSNHFSGNQFQSDRSDQIKCSFFVCHFLTPRKMWFVENMLNVFAETRLCCCCEVQIKWKMTMYCWPTHLFEFWDQRRIISMESAHSSFLHFCCCLVRCIWSSATAICCHNVRQDLYCCCGLCLALAMSLP